MEGDGDHRVPLALALAVVFGVAVPAAAQEATPQPWKPRPSVVVRTQPDAAVVEAEAHGHEATNPPGGLRGAKRKCRLEPQGNLGAGSAGLWAEHPDETLYAVFCEGKVVGFVWRKINLSPANRSPTDPREVALHLREEIPVPTAAIRTNPLVGLVGTESWFWVDGYSGEPITESTDALGRRVDVEARVTRYEWSFGDGTSMIATSPGRRFPEPSDIRHIFQRSSRLTDGGYPVLVRFTYNVRYRIEGGVWIGLPGISREATALYRVMESQAVIVR